MSQIGYSSRTFLPSKTISVKLGLPNFYVLPVTAPMLVFFFLAGPPAARYLGAFFWSPLPSWLGTFFAPSPSCYFFFEIDPNSLFLIASAVYFPAPNTANCTSVSSPLRLSWHPFMKTKTFLLDLTQGLLFLALCFFFSPFFCESASVDLRGKTVNFPLVIYPDTSSCGCSHPTGRTADSPPRLNSVCVLNPVPGTAYPLAEASPLVLKSR